LREGDAEKKGRKVSAGAVYAVSETGRPLRIRRRKSGKNRGISGMQPEI